MWKFGREEVILWALIHRISIQDKLINYIQYGGTHCTNDISSKNLVRWKSAAFCKCAISGSDSLFQVCTRLALLLYCGEATTSIWQAKKGCLLLIGRNVSLTWGCLLRLSQIDKNELILIFKIGIDNSVRSPRSWHVLQHAHDGHTSLRGSAIMWLC